MKIQKPAKIVLPKSLLEARPAKPSKAFGEVMKQKAREAKPEAPAPQPDPMPMPFRELAFIAESKPVVPTSRTETVQAVQALAAELVERVEFVGPSEVRIEFQSNVLEGLIVIAKREGNSLEVKFETAVPEVAALLAGNSEILSERLERLGYASRIAVHEARERAPAYEDRGSGQRQQRDEGDEEDRS